MTCTLGSRHLPLAVKIVKSCSLPCSVPSGTVISILPASGKLVPDSQAPEAFFGMTVTLPGVITCGPLAGPVMWNTMIFVRIAQTCSGLAVIFDGFTFTLTIGLLGPPSGFSQNLSICGESHPPTFISFFPTQLVRKKLSGITKRIILFIFLPLFDWTWSSLIRRI